MSSTNYASKATDTLHKGVDNLESSIAEAEVKVRDVAQEASGRVHELSDEAQAQVSNSLSAVEQYVKEKPLQAAGIAFAAGVLAAMILRRN